MSNTYPFDKFQEIWDYEPIVIFDANAILNIYKYSPETTDNILSHLSTLAEQLWIPHQAFKEYKENRQDVINGQHNKYKDVTREVERIMGKAKNDIEEQFVRFSSFKFPLVNDLGKKILEAIESILEESRKFQTELKEEAKKNTRMLKEDKVNEFVEELVQSGRVGPPYNIPTLLRIYEEGERRYKYLIPPGYKDIEKDKTDSTRRRKYGDLVLWKQLLEQAHASNKPVIFVSFDQKEDWWKLDKNQIPVEPREELFDEFRQYSNQPLAMMTLNDFINHFSRYTGMVNIQTYIEMNPEEVCGDLIEVKGWDVILDKGMQLTSYLIHDGDLAEHEITDVEILEVFEPELDIELVDMDGDQFDISGFFECKVIIDATKNYFGSSKLTVIVEGSFSCEFNANIQNGNISLEPTSIIAGGFSVKEVTEEIEYDEEYDNDRCVSCGNPNAPYFVKNDDRICERCSGHYDTCPDCGILYEHGTLGGAYCSDCEENH